MHEVSSVNAKVEGEVQLLRWLEPFIQRLYFIYARKNYATVEIHPKKS